MSDNQLEKQDNKDTTIVTEKIEHIKNTRQKYKGWYFVKTY